MSTSEETVLNQKKWLHDLTSGNLIKITGDLSRYFKDSQGLKVGYCAMGVAGRVLGQSDQELRARGQEDKIGNDLGLPSKVTAYVVCMNDGATLHEKLDPYNLNKERKLVRASRQERSFEFIARWLEIYFALERKRESQL